MLYCNSHSICNYSKEFHRALLIRAFKIVNNIKAEFKSSKAILREAK